MSVAAPEFGAIAQSTRAAGIGASPASNTPLLNNVCDGRSGSNGPNLRAAKACHTRENSPNGFLNPQSSTASKNCGTGNSSHADWAPCPSTSASVHDNPSWISQNIAGFALNGSWNDAIAFANAAQSFGIVIEAPSPSSP